ncbi:Nif3-like dinuclear metal center hexameric protein [Salirhabdus salicampi]|uniref:Nif3-like dinuclear metal center hexameric protein n=1 Tax=Salirhabdus salicampi TaxID=476102 RepID=UPI0020C2E276|nr:Nif3-like dinuclear metal center hexameric protein [Salirhabdus salicampi]MCP8616887.1 Nif3-like dinuclear metal center hexameric protein [Salirhabdus salicampi]
MTPKKTVTGTDVIKLFEEWSPKSVAMEGDPVGLHVGTLNKPIQKVMVTLDVLENVVDEAVKEKVDLIIAHHPLIFKPLHSVSLDNEKGRIINKLLKHDIAVYAAHTNLDIINGGVNDLLMDELGIMERDILIETESETLYKLVVFVPTTHQEQLREALGNSGAGHIGLYSHCTFQTSGQGTFKPLEGTNPFIGEAGKVEKVDEVRIETIVPKSKLAKVLVAMESAHPYEEVAYDVIPLLNEGTKRGLGRIGKLIEPMTLEQFAQHVKKSLNVPALRMVGDSTKPVKTVAVLGGDGNKFIHKAKRKGADVLITGDLYYHTAHDAMAIGLNVLDPGHHIEKVMKKGVRQFLETTCKEHGLQVEIIESKAVTEPFQFL